MGLDHKIEPKLIRPFSDETFKDLQNHVRQVRRLFDWPGIAYHDKDTPKENLFNRWYWHNPPLAKYLHNTTALRAVASEVFGREVKPSYCFLSMYGPEGVCPVHTDRPQCQFTIDLLVDGGEEWPIYVDEKPYISKPGEGLCYSGTGQVHYRKAMKEDSAAKHADLVFFHFVPVEWQGPLD
jgi:hypothetical protein